MRVDEILDIIHEVQRPNQTDAPKGQALFGGENGQTGVAHCRPINILNQNLLFDGQIVQIVLAGLGELQLFYFLHDLLHFLFRVQALVFWVSFHLSQDILDVGLAVHDVWQVIEKLLDELAPDRRVGGRGTAVRVAVRAKIFPARSSKRRHFDCVLFTVFKKGPAIYDRFVRLDGLRLRILITPWRLSLICGLFSITSLAFDPFERISNIKGLSTCSGGGTPCVRRYSYWPRCGSCGSRTC